MLRSAIRLDDGFSTIYSFENVPTVKLYERDVTPPGMSAGGPIDTTTMRNIAWRTMAPRQLKTLTQMQSTVAYATEVYPILYDQIGCKQRITITFPDQSTLLFWGWIEEFTPSALTEGEQPTAALVIQPSNTNADDVEEAPVYTDSPAESGS